MATVVETVRDDFRKPWDSPKGIASLSVVNHKTVGLRFMVTAFLFFLVGGLIAVTMRTQLAVPENTLLSPRAYNALFTLHGATMMFFFAVPFVEGLGNYLLPLMLGSRDLPFPRLNAFNYWVYLFGGVMFYSSVLFGVPPDGGWFSYPPLTGPRFSPGPGIDFFMLGVTLAEISAIGAAIELIVVILKMRAPGMTLHRMPLFAWTMLVTSTMIVLAFTPLVVGTAFLEMDRQFGTDFYSPAGGGNPVLWQHLFWFFGHPEVYVMFLPATGIVSHVVQTFSRRPVAGYIFVVLAILVTGFLSFGLWVHHMFTVGLPVISMNLFTAASMMIAIASGVQIVAWITTLWLGRPVLRVPLLFVVGFIVTFVLGGITGVMVAAVPFDLQVHDSFFLVAHFHYVLIGGVVLPMLAGLYYWIPKFTGWLLNERLGVWNFWTVFAGLNLTFFPMHVMGFLGMPRRVYTFREGLGLGGLNLASTIGAYLLAIGFLLFVVNFVWSKLMARQAAPDPHGADTLEWSVESPPPGYNFRSIPIVRGRHPMWEAPRPEEEREPAPPWTLDEEPRGWRASIGTSVLDAQPDSLVHMPGPTLWPLWPAIGIAVAFAGLIAKSTAVVVAGGILVLVGFLGWAVRNERERMAASGTIIADLSVEGPGPRSVSWWGAVLFVAVAVSALGTMVFSYFFLRVHAEVWPLGGVEAPDLLFGALILGVVLVAPAVTLWAGRRVRHPDRRPAIPLLVALAAGIAAVVLLAIELGPQRFALATNAYTSLFGATVLLLGGLVVVAVVLTAIAWARAVSGGARSRVALLVSHVGLVWWFVLASAVVVLAMLYLTPALS